MHDSTMTNDHDHAQAFLMSLAHVYAERTSHSHDTGIAIVSTQITFTDDRRSK